jgi:integrase
MTAGGGSGRTVGVERTAHGWRVRWTDPWSRRTAKGGFRTKADADAYYRRILGDMARGEYMDPRAGRITLAAWADDWLAGARNLSRGGRDTYRRDLDRHILPVLGKVPVGRLGADDIDRYLTGLLVQRPPDGRPARGLAHSPGASLPDPRRGEAVPCTGLAPSTVHRHYRTLHRMLEVAWQRGMIARNPTEFVQPPVVPKQQRPVLDPLQVDALADHIAPRYRAWVYVMCYGTLRWSEAVGLRRMDVVTDEGPAVSAVSSRGAFDEIPPAINPGVGGATPAANRRERPSGATTRLIVAGQLVHRGPGEWERCEPKAGSKRSVTLPEFAAVELVAHLDTYSLPGADGLVFPTRNGTPIQSPSFTANVFKRALRKAGLPDMRIHDLRHTAVSLALAAGIDPKISQARAGHRSSSLHMDTYGHLFAGADEAVAVRLDQLRAEALRNRLRAV